MNKKHALIVIAFISHIANAEEGKITPDSDLNYSNDQIVKDYDSALPLFLQKASTRLIPIEIKDNKDASYVKIVLRRLDKPKLVEGRNSSTQFTIRTNNEVIQVVYNKQEDFLFIDTSMQQTKEKRQEQGGSVQVIYSESRKEHCLSKKLSGPIDPKKKKTAYNEEKKELTIIIPKLTEKQRQEKTDNEN